MRASLFLSLLLMAALCASPSQTNSAASKPDQSARNPFEGAKIFQQHCAACHGADGRGHGPAAAALKHDVPDLTLISQKNHGKFPYQGVRNVIEGLQAPSRAHGTREMPIWGPVFHQVEADQDWGEVRLDAVTRHLESIQRKQGGE